MSWEPLIVHELAHIRRQLEFIINWQSLGGHWKAAEEARELALTNGDTDATAGMED